jgi:hypothetical protein
MLEVNVLIENRRREYNRIKMWYVNLGQVTYEPKVP